MALDDQVSWRSVTLRYSTHSESLDIMEAPGAYTYDWPKMPVAAISSWDILFMKATVTSWSALYDGDSDNKLRHSSGGIF